MMNSEAEHAKDNPLIYIVDDEQGMLEMIAAACHANGFRCRCFADARSLLAALNEAPKIIVLDLAMPQFDGIEVIRELSRLTCKSELIIISGFEQRLLNSVAHLAKSLGLNLRGILCKPFRINELLQLFRIEQHYQKAKPIHQAKSNFAGEELRSAIRNQELVVHYQPQIAFKDQTWNGVEALVRWQHPQHGLLGPDSFIPEMESHDLVGDLTEVVLRQTLADFNCLYSLGLQGTVSVNLPAGALNAVDFPDRVAKYIDSDGVPHGRVAFELTETSIAESKTYASDILTRLSLKGFLLSIDDFGTGYSSLEALHRLPFNELKIDRSFVQCADQDPVAKAIVEHSVALARGLKMKVVAEGVETVPQMQWLSQLGCHTMQGYLISKPLPIDQIAHWYVRWTAERFAVPTLESHDDSTSLC